MKRDAGVVKEKIRGDENGRALDVEKERGRDVEREAFFVPGKTGR